MTLDYKMSLPECIIFFIVCDSYASFSIQFFCMIYAIKSRLEKVNEMLSKTFHIDGALSSPGSLIAKDELLKEAAVIYDKLMDLTEEINKIYGVLVRKFCK